MKIEEVLDSLPEVSFIDNKTYEDVKEEMISDFLEEFKRLSGEEAIPSEANMFMAILNAVSLQIYQGFEYIDYAGKMGLTKYTHGKFLDNMAMLKGIMREEAKAASCELEFGLSSVREMAIPIPKGSRVTDGALYFYTEEYAEIKPGDLSVRVKASCTEKGVLGNEIKAGRLNTLVNPIPFVSTVKNVTETTGGKERDDDLEMKNNFTNPQGGQVAIGTEEGYKFFAKKADSRVADAVVESNEDSTIEVTISQKDIGLPESSLIQIVLDYMKNKYRKALGDKIEVKAPTQVEYDIQLTYYISSEKKEMIEKIKESVNQAISSYVEWQGEKMGRDINPSVLIQRVVEAGAKRVDVVSPSFAVVENKQIAKKRGFSVSYGGLEDD